MSKRKHTDIDTEGELLAVNSISAVDASAKMMYYKFNRRAVGANDVHIEIKYSGICHSDIHTAKGDWGPKTYPLCVGHEILGDVIAVGESVTKFAVGDLAGVGCFVDSCRSCVECKEGDENYCSGGGMHGTYGKKLPTESHPEGQSMGGYSSAVVVDENYVIKVPKHMDTPGTAPLLCAGITCYSPFKHYGVKAGNKLGVVGLGGLGHMAVKIAKAMGCEVTVLSRTPDKKDMAMSMGADKFIVSTDEEEMKTAAKTLNYIYDSIAFKHDIVPYLNLLRSSGTLITVGGILEPYTDICSFGLVPRRLSVVGSCIGGINETQEMIDFCAKHNIVSDIELIPATPEAVEKAYVRAEKSDVKFRFVIDTKATMPPLK